MPELDLLFAQAPAQQHLSPTDLTREVHESHPAILELDAELLELLLVSVDLPGQGLRFAFELFGAVTWLVDTRRRGDEVELENLLAPLTMLAHHVFDDSTDERKCPVGFVDGEESGNHGYKDTPSRRFRSVSRSASRTLRRCSAAWNRRTWSGVSATTPGISIGFPLRSTATNVR